MSKENIKSYLGYAVVIGIIGFVLAQFARFVVPDFKLDNPPVTQTVNWDSPETERLWTVACADCHSNETVYPWYSYVAPVGWLVAHDIHEGRDRFNSSTDPSLDMEEMEDQILEGGMPLPIYLPMHPEADLSPEDQQALIDGLRATFIDASESSERDSASESSDGDDDD